MAGRVGFEPTTSRVTVEVTVFFTTGRPSCASASFRILRPVRFSSFVMAALEAAIQGPHVTRVEQVALDGRVKPDHDVG
jgi:hypothetical protein